jgi:hypothetical protein
MFCDIAQRGVQALGTRAGEPAANPQIGGSDTLGEEAAQP